MRCWLILVISLPLIRADCEYPSEWFNENQPWTSNSQGHDIERFPLIRAKYPWKFEIARWIGTFEIRRAQNQYFSKNTTELIEKYVRISDGLICHAVNGQRCVDYEVDQSFSSNPFVIIDLSIRFDSVWNTIYAAYRNMQWLNKIGLTVSKLVHIRCHGSFPFTILTDLFVQAH
jgi:hypothetical protein